VDGRSILGVTRRLSLLSQAGGSQRFSAPGTRASLAMTRAGWPCKVFCVVIAVPCRLFRRCSGSRPVGDGEGR